MWVKGLLRKWSKAGICLNVTHLNPNTEYGRCPPALHQLPCVRCGWRRPLQSDPGQGGAQAKGEVWLQALPAWRLQDRQWGQEQETLQTGWDEGLWFSLKANPTDWLWWLTCATLTWLFPFQLLKPLTLVGNWPIMDKAKLKCFLHKKYGKHMHNNGSNSKATVWKLWGNY